MKLISDYLEYLKDNPKGYWFKAKLYGWGWTPAKWQGWLTLGVFIVLLLFDYYKLSLMVRSENELLMVFLPHVALLTFVLILICYIKGEPPRWKWGRK